MTELFQRISHPEVFLGIVAPIGTDLTTTTEALRDAFAGHNYHVRELRITDLFPKIKVAIPRLPELITSNSFDRYRSYINFGNNLRSVMGDDAIMASLASLQITEARRVESPSETGLCERVVYILRQLKRKEETDRLRQIYGNLFFQISVYTNRNARVDNLSRAISSSRFQGNSQLSRSDAEQLVLIDEHEAGNEHGQKVSDVFHDADAIINKDAIEQTEIAQINRIVSLMFGANDISPNKIEYGMYAAKSASLRSLDLSRQVGAAIFSKDAEILSMGCNEVPKAGGGSYWSDEKSDARDYTKSEDTNHRRKREILYELIKIISPECNQDYIWAKKELQDSQFMDALEYGRIVHAEMSAICDAARNGLKLKGSTLFCTTFPCHMCSKHIVAAGIEKVVYLEPYPKSLAIELNNDSFSIEGSGQDNGRPPSTVKCCHFFGISPRRYREFFERKKRKDPNGRFSRWKSGIPQPIVDIFIPNYLTNEANQIKLIISYFKQFDVNIQSLFD